MAGSITITTSDLGGGISKYSVAWLSSAGGAVSANTLDLKRGYLVQAKFVPDGGGTQPTDQYDVTLTDASGVDALAGAGANLSNAAASIAELSLVLEAGAYTPTISNAGNAKGGTIVLLVGLVGDAVGASSVAAASEATAANQTLQITQETALNTVLGAKTDAKSTATDTTSISAMSVWKQISASVQAIVTAIAAFLTVKIDQTTPGTTNGVVVSTSPVSGGTVTDKSGTITSGGSAQTLMALNASRRGGGIQNQSTGDLWVRATSAAAATQPSFWLPAGAFVSLDELGITTELVSIFGATTGQAFAAREW